METKITASREVMTAEEVADFLGCGRTYVYKLLRDGEIPSVKIGRLRRVRRVDVDAYLQERVRSGQ